MTTLAFERMRRLSHACIKRQIDSYEQRYRLLSRSIDKKTTCKYFAESAFLLCAVNPSGPCSECGHHELKNEITI